jgi:hypothetical protein
MFNTASYRIPFHFKHVLYEAAVKQETAADFCTAHLNCCFKKSSDAAHDAKLSFMVQAHSDTLSLS